MRTLRYYTANELARHQEHFRRFLLDVTAADPAQPIGSLNLLEAAERRQILVDWNDTSHPVPQSTFPVLFEEQVQRRPNSIALVFEDQSLTYEELNVRANRLAHYLIKIGVGPEDIVALALERSIESRGLDLGDHEGRCRLSAARSKLSSRAAVVHDPGC